MLLGVVSDTHGDEYTIKKVIEEFKNLDMVIHLGDNVEDAEVLKENLKGKVILVRGNCDIGSKEPLELIEIVEGNKIFITHGHRYNVKNTLSNLFYRAQELDAQIALFGHTHVSEIEFEQGIWMINPGSAALPRDMRSSVAIIDIQQENINASIKLI